MQPLRTTILILDQAFIHPKGFMVDELIGQYMH